MVLLCCYLNDRWARDGLTAKEATRASLSKHVLFEITGRNRLKSARTSLEVLSKFVSISIEVDGEFTLIRWPKFAKFQDLGARSPGSHFPQNAPPADARRRRKTQTQKPRDTSASPPPTGKSTSSRKKRKPETECLENPTAQQWTQIRAWRDKNHQSKFTDAELEAQWTLHYQHAQKYDIRAAKWVMSFYNWLTGPYYKRATASTLGVRKVPNFKPRDGPRLSESPEDAARLKQEFAEMRKEDAPTARRRL